MIPQTITSSARRLAASPNSNLLVLAVRTTPSLLSPDSQAHLNTRSNTTMATPPTPPPKTARAAFLTAPQAHPLTILPCPVPTPGPHQLLIKNHALAINPIDAKLQRRPFYPLSYPAVLGHDVAGEVVQVGGDSPPGGEEEEGEGERRGFRVGDRVVGLTAGFVTKGEGEEGFREYTVLESRLAVRIPGGMGWERGVVLPMGVATAAAGLFGENALGLRLPTSGGGGGGVDSDTGPSGGDETRGTLLIWGGASSVGCNAVQLARAAGYEVFATASARNADMVAGLGAARVFDYRSGNIVREIVEALKGRNFVGAYDVVGGEACGQCVEVVKQLQEEGGGNTVKRIVATAVVFEKDYAGPELGDVRLVKTFSLSIRGDGVAEAVYGGFLEGALEEGSYVTAPEPLVVEGRGLEAVQAGIDRQAEGVSAQKVVVLL